MNTRNSSAVIWVDTSMHRATLCEMDADTRYPIEDLRQGRDCKTPVPRFSPMAGRPFRSERDEEINAAVRAFYLAVVLTAACAVVLAYWPN